MSLNWDATEVLDWKELHSDETEQMTTQACVFTCMYIGMGVITPANWQEWFIRANIWERCFGSYLREGSKDKGWVPVFITVADVIRRIGLRTNAQTYSTTQFKSKIFDILQGKAIDEMQQEDVKWLIS